MDDQGIDGTSGDIRMKGQREHFDMHTRVRMELLFPRNDRAEAESNKASNGRTGRNKRC